MTKADPGIGRAQKPDLGTTFEMAIERIGPTHELSFRWHPLTTGGDYAAEPPTLITFELEEAANSTKLTITESGAGQPWIEQAISRCLWRPRGIALPIEKYLKSAMDLKPWHGSPERADDRGRARPVSHRSRTNRAGGETNA